MSSTAPSGTPRQHPSSRRISQVYVEIPPSPYSRAGGNAFPLSPHVHRSTGLKENAVIQSSKTMPRAAGGTIFSTPPSVLKRKLSMAVVINSAKKPKLSTSADMNARPELQEKAVQSKLDAACSKPANASDEFPNGSFYCHQCSRKRDLSTGIQCTVKVPRTTAKRSVTQEGRCPLKYCKPCLKNRYGEDMEGIKAKPRSPSKKDKPHIDWVSYIFKCPKCRDACNCSRCRKMRGLAPTGNLALVARKADAEIAASRLGNHSTTNSIHPSKGTYTVSSEKRPGAKTSKPKPLPDPKWEELDIDLTLGQAEARIQIREFVVRFASLMEGMARSHVEELDEIVGKHRGKRQEEEDGADEVWVSEPCVKAVVLGLLGLIASGEEGGNEKVFKAAIKDIRGSGANLNKIWGVLASMRDSLSKNPLATTSPFSGAFPLTFPDPHPPPNSVPAHSIRVTRRGPTHNPAQYIVHSAQMVPVLLALTNLATQTEVIRENIESAVKSGKEWVKQGREGCKRENERWDEEKKVLEGGANGPDKDHEIKVKRDAHDKVLRDLQHSLEVVMFGYAPRFRPLGKDTDGRVYWALSPGIIEKDNALKIIISGRHVKDGNRGKGKGRARSAEERKEMREWPWFVAVWGRRPVVQSGAAGAKHNRADLEDSDDEDEVKWWGFWEPEEIRRLAGWLEGNAKLDQGDMTGSTLSSAEQSGGSNEDIPTSDVCGPPTKDEMRNLIQALENYAKLLEWRIKFEDGPDEKHSDAESVPTTAKGKGRAEVSVVPPGRFYG